jgi:hypothetical protein
MDALLLASTKASRSSFAPARMQPMNEKTRKEKLDAIEAVRAEAARLLDAANDETLKNFIQFTWRDLDESVEMLHRKGNPVPSMLSRVDAQIRVATWRLKTVSWALRTYGPDAKLFGE